MQQDMDHPAAHYHPAFTKKEVAVPTAPRFEKCSSHSRAPGLVTGHGKLASVVVYESHPLRILIGIASQVASCPVVCTIRGGGKEKARK